MPTTPLLTFYAVLMPRRKRIPVASIDDYPNDWIEVKTILKEIARKIYVEYNQVETIFFLERHMPGKFFVGFTSGSYIQEKVRYKRMKEAFFKVEYNPLSDSIEKIQASFSFNLSQVAAEYSEIEKGRRWKTTPLIPRDHKSFLEDPRQIIKEPSTTRYADYSRQPKNLYGYGDEYHPRRMIYERAARLEYDKRP